MRPKRRGPRWRSPSTISRLDEVISFTAVTNDKSRRVMQKLGMTHDPDGDFEHPSVAEGSPLRPTFSTA